MALGACDSGTIPGTPAGSYELATIDGEPPADMVEPVIHDAEASVFIQSAVAAAELTLRSGGSLEMEYVVTQYIYEAGTGRFLGEQRIDVLDEGAWSSTDATVTLSGVDGLVIQPGDRLDGGLSLRIRPDFATDFRTWHFQPR